MSGDAVGTPGPTSSVPDSDAAGRRIRLSVVMTIVEGPEALRSSLEALDRQVGAPPLEVIVPFDESVAWAEDVARGSANVRCVTMGTVVTGRPIGTPAGQHELYDRRRAAGLREARGEIVAILEDRGVPDPDWAAQVDRLHAALPHGVIGGAVECGVDTPLAWAVYFCDFSRYQLPFVAGARPYVTDVNISYKRGALERTEPLWRDRYHETTVHWALTREGETLYLAPEPVVRQMRSSLALTSVLRERYDWGRLFAYTRARESTPGRRLLLAALSPVLPVVLFARHARTTLVRHGRARRFLRASPNVLLLLVAWSLGELVGYVTGRP